MTRKEQVIMKILRQFKNIIREGFVGMWRNFGMTAASVVSITFVLLMFGIISLLVLNVEQVVFESGAKLQKIVVFFENNTPEEKLVQVEKQFQEMDGVDGVEFTNQDQALDEMKDRLKGDDYILEGLPENPLPVSFTLHLRSLDDGEKVAKEAKAIPGVYKVQYFNDLVDNMLRIYRGVRQSGTVVVGILLLIAIILIHNTIRITLQNRQREIQIMRYVGANNYYIRGPFLIEGLFFGLFAGILSCLVLYFLYQYAYNRFNPQLLNILGVGFYKLTKRMSLDLFLILASLGMGIGYLGSVISVTRHLDV